MYRSGRAARWKSNATMIELRMALGSGWKPNAREHQSRKKDDRLLHCMCRRFDRVGYAGRGHARVSRQKLASWWPIAQGNSSLQALTIWAKSSWTLVKSDRSIDAFKQKSLASWRPPPDPYETKSLIPVGPDMQRPIA